VPRKPLYALALLGALVLLAAAAGCGGSSGETATSAVETGQPQPGPPETVPEVGAALQSFVEAAGSGDGARMWTLLATETQKRLGPSEKEFERRYGKDFRTGVGSFAGTGYRVVLSVETESGWGVAAVAGDRVRQGKSEYAAYGVALREEGDGWKLVLGEPVRIENVSPAALTTPERRPEIGVRIRSSAPVDEAGIWLDGDPLPAKVVAASGRDVSVEATPGHPLAPGWHVVVVLGRAGEAAAAGAQPFRVDADSGPVA
jgi:hypothetical protein